MDSRPASGYQRPRNAILFVLRTGLIAGGLDILAAFVDAYLSYGSSPDRVLRFIASGVFGKEAFTGGSEMVLWGCIFHFCIAMSWSLLFFLLYPKLSLLSRNVYVYGIIYGLFIWLVMNLIVLPQSNIPRSAFNLFRAVKGAGILAVMVGLPVSISVHKYFLRKQQKTN